MIRLTETSVEVFQGDGRGLSVAKKRAGPSPNNSRGGGPTGIEGLFYARGAVWAFRGRLSRGE